MRQDIQEIFNFSITVREVIGNTMWAALCGAIISLFYFIAFKKVSYSVNIIKSIVMLTMITAFVMMVVGDNLAQAFSMVGILSIIRFRTAMKGAQDFMFLFFALGIGLACGEGLYLVALSGCLLIGLVTVVMAQASGIFQPKDFTLTLTINESENSRNEYKDVLQLCCRRYRMISTKVINKDNNCSRQLRYSIRLKDTIDSEQLVNKMRNAEGIQDVSLEFEEE